jgi:hypothetical protein
MLVTTEGVSRLECRNLCAVVVARPLQSLSGVSHPKEISVPIITISTSNRIQNSQVRKTSWAKPSSASYSFTTSICLSST